MTDTYGIVPPSGKYGTDWPANHVLTQGKGGSISSAGWTEGAEGFPQQTFLGASIIQFDISAGFEDTSSTLSVEVVNDEYNKSDGFGIGYGDDIYHNGVRDGFKPPVVGTPVFFKFGKNYATIEQAFRRTIDVKTGYKTVPDEIDFPTIEVEGDIEEVPDYHYLRSTTTRGDGNKVSTFVDKSQLWDANYAFRGKDHFVFGGILQSYNENESDQGSTYNITVTDPREILSNVVVLLNNYQGTTYNNKNLINAYGFLEYDPTETLLAELENPIELLSKNVLQKNVNDQGVVFYTGDDTYRYNQRPFTLNSYPATFPITGQGFSRRGDQGIPWYRVNQALTALFNYDGALPTEYVNAGFGGAIDFRGYKYVVDFGGIPLSLIPQMYFLDFDQMTLLELAQELCDVISHDLFVSLHPVIDHPSNEWLWNYNNAQIQAGNYTDIIAGIIRVDAIDRSEQPQYGVVTDFLNNLSANGIDVKNKDVGFELSNVTTDKFVVGAQEIRMHYFTGSRDRNNLQLRRRNAGLANSFEQLEEEQWSLNAALKQQILPFYGFLGKDAVTIPRGFGSYQQIMLDASSLNANGVGNYYITTEIELRVALRSFEDWAKFLADYSELYMEDADETGKAFYKAFAEAEIDFSEAERMDIGGEGPYFYTVSNAITALQSGRYGVSVPRCVFNSDKDYMGADGYPASPCAPPYGYPLYYKRAEKIGIPQAGIVNFLKKSIQVQTNLDKMKDRLKQKLANDGVEFNNEDAVEKIRETIDNLNQHAYSNLSPELQKRVHNNANVAEALAEDYEQLVGAISRTQYILNNKPNLIRDIKRLAADGTENAKRVYNFVRNVAEKHLGKTFMVKIPQYCNLAYSNNIQVAGGGEIEAGPFGFQPLPINTGINYLESEFFKNELAILNSFNKISDVGFNSTSGPREVYTHYLDVNASGRYSYGALKTNFNPVSETWNYNYKPAPDGGFFDFGMYQNAVSRSEGSGLNENKLPPVTRQMLAPRDITNLSTDRNRIKAYVRFDHSQYLDLSTVSKDRMIQQKITREGYVPDVLEELDNTGNSEIPSLDRIQDQKNPADLPDACAYVSCELDPNLYMPARVVTTNVRCYGRNVKWVPSIPEVDMYQTTDDDDCLETRPAVRDFNRIFSPASNGGSDGYFAVNGDFARKYVPELDAHIVDTEKKNLDDRHVYAIITIPRVKPTLETRYNDAQSYEINAAQIKHNLTQDVVRGPDGFEKPGMFEWASNFRLDCKDLVRYGNNLAEGVRAARDAMSSFAIAGDLDRNQQFFEPSPVYPDLVSLPLMSEEHCYGPWLSAASVNSKGDDRLRYSDIGGKIEFVKDENLAPWNYAGYQLMNEAGKLQAQFSNSLLLFSERGGYTVAEAPTGIRLASAIAAGGPLVTSVQVSVGNDGIETTVQMDLYTASFGKLQKQKEGNIARIARERQKIIDERNALIRKGLGKSAGQIDFRSIAQGTRELINFVEDRTSKEIARQDSILKYTTQKVVEEKRDLTNGEAVEQRRTYMESGLTSSDKLQDERGNMDTAQRDARNQNTATFNISDALSPVSTRSNVNFPMEEVSMEEKRNEEMLEEADNDS